jgi:hypothetical protein
VFHIREPTPLEEECHVVEGIIHRLRLLHLRQRSPGLGQPEHHLHYYGELTISSGRDTVSAWGSQNIISIA